jgi:hypothetical protein
MKPWRDHLKQTEDMKRLDLRLALVLLACAGCTGVVVQTPTDSGTGGGGGEGGGSAGGGGSGGGSAVVDAGMEDAGVLDAGVQDAGALDAGVQDAGTVDAGAPHPIFVIGGQDLRRLVSFDGKTWQHDVYVAPNGEDNAFDAVAIGNGAIVLSGDPGIYRSTDGINWSLAFTRPSRFAFHGSASVFGGGAFVIVAQDAAYKSTDGLTWITAAATGNSGHWQSIAYGNGHWVAFGDGHRKTSEDGLAWHDYTAVADPNPFQAAAYGNGVFVAVGGINNMARVSTSPDGVTWTERAPVATSYNTGFAGIAFGNGKFLTNDCCNAFESADGIAWTKRGAGKGASIVFAGGTFVASGWRTAAYLYSPDAGAFTATFSGDQPNQFPDAGLWPWFTGVGAGEL